jgi:hypothetical protein
MCSISAASRISRPGHQSFSGCASSSRRFHVAEKLEQRQPRRQQHEEKGLVRQAAPAFRRVLPETLSRFAVRVVVHWCALAGLRYPNARFHSNKINMRRAELSLTFPARNKYLPQVHVEKFNLSHHRRRRVHWLAFD